MRESSEANDPRAIHIPRLLRLCQFDSISSLFLASKRRLVWQQRRLGGRRCFANAFGFDHGNRPKRTDLELFWLRVIGLSEGGTPQVRWVVAPQSHSDAPFMWSPSPQAGAEFSVLAVQGPTTNYFG